MDIPQMPAPLLKRCYVTKRTEKKKKELTGEFLLALQVRNPGTADLALQTAKPGGLTRAKKGEKVAQQDQVTQLRNTFRSKPWICLRKNGCFLSLAAVSILERALFLIHGPKRAQLFAEDFLIASRGTS